MVATKHKIEPLNFNPATFKLIDFLDELRKLAKDAFGVASQAIIEHFIYATMPLRPRKSISQVHMENSTYEQVVSNL